MATMAYLWLPSGAPSCSKIPISQWIDLRKNRQETFKIGGRNHDFRWRFSIFFPKSIHWDTVDGRNPAPPWMVEFYNGMFTTVFNWCRSSSTHSTVCKSYIYLLTRSVYFYNKYAYFKFMFKLWCQCHPLRYLHPHGFALEKPGPEGLGGGGSRPARTEGGGGPGGTKGGKRRDAQSDRWGHGQLRGVRDGSGTTKNHGKMMGSIVLSCFMAFLRRLNQPTWWFHRDWNTRS